MARFIRITVYIRLGKYTNLLLCIECNLRLFCRPAESRKFSRKLVWCRPNRFQTCPRLFWSADCRWCPSPPWTTPTVRRSSRSSFWRFSLHILVDITITTNGTVFPEEKLQMWEQIYSPMVKKPCDKSPEVSFLMVSTMSLPARFAYSSKMALNCGYERVAKIELKVDSSVPHWASPVKP